MHVLLPARSPPAQVRDLAVALADTRTRLAPRLAGEEKRHLRAPARGDVVPEGSKVKLRVESATDGVEPLRLGRASRAGGQAGPSNDAEAFCRSPCHACRRSAMRPRVRAGRIAFARVWGRGRGDRGS